MNSESNILPIVGTVLAEYPLRNVYSTAKIVTLMILSQCVAGGYLYMKLDGDSDLFVVCMAAYSAFLLVVFLTRSMKRIGNGEIELSDQQLRIPTMAGPIDLLVVHVQIDARRLKEAMPTMELTSEGKKVQLTQAYFVDPDHFRQLREDIHIVAAGGVPQGTAATRQF